MNLQNCIITSDETSVFSDYYRGHIVCTSLSRDKYCTKTAHILILDQLY